MFARTPCRCSTPLRAYVEQIDHARQTWRGSRRTMTPTPRSCGASLGNAMKWPLLADHDPVTAAGAHVPIPSLKTGWRVARYAGRVNLGWERGSPETRDSARGGHRLPDEPESNGVPVNRRIDERKDRERLAASRLNIEWARCGGQQTLLEAARIQQRPTADADRGFDAGRQEHVAGV
jgi:hypothetical protein